MRRFFRYIKREKWQFLFYLVVFFGILQIVFYGIFYYKKRIFSYKLATLNQTISEKDKQIANLTQNENIKKYLILRKLNKLLKPTIWSDVMESMMNIYNNVNKLARGTFRLTNFNINMTDLNLQGEVTDLSYVYRTNGLIDQFERLDFITHMNIPFYKKMGNFYQFSLNAKIKINGTSKQ